MKVYLVSNGYCGKYGCIDRVEREVFATRELAEAKVRELIAEAKKRIRNSRGADVKMTERKDFDYDRHWLFYDEKLQCSDCWEIHELDIISRNE